MYSIPDIDEARQSRNRLAELLRRDREATADFIVAVSEFDKRRLWLELGFNCLFNFLHRGLRMSRSAAHYRRVAAELAQRFPEIVEPLRDGRLCISVVSELAKVLTEPDRSVLERFFWISVDRAKEIVAELNPVLDPPRREVITAVQPVAARATSTALSGTVPGIVPVVRGASSEPRIGPPSLTEDVRDMPSDDAAAVPAHQTAVVDAVGLDGARVLHGTASLPLRGSSRESSDPDHVAANGPAISPGRGSAPDDVTEVWTEPLGRNLYRLHVTVTQAFMEKLDAARDALAFKKIRRKADVLEAALDIVLARQAKRRGETNRPQQNPRSSTDPAHIPARVKRAVGKRDGWRCQFPTDSGGICGSKRHIQFDHIVPSALGGPSTIENVRVLCATHNVVAARLALGDHVMDRYTQRGRREHAAPAANDAPKTERYSDNETG